MIIEWLVPDTNMVVSARRACLMPISGCRIYSLVFWNSRPQVFKDVHSLFLVAIDYFKSLFALSSTSKRKVELYYRDRLREKSVFHDVGRYLANKPETDGLLGLKFSSLKLANLFKEYGWSGVRNLSCG